MDHIVLRYTLYNTQCNTYTVNGGTKYTLYNVQFDFVISPGHIKVNRYLLGRCKDNTIHGTLVTGMILSI